MRRFAAMLTIILGLMLLESSETLTFAARDDDQVGFNWAFAALVQEGKDRKMVSITQDTTLKTGDRLKMLISLKKKCFVYVIYHSLQSGVHLLFPYSLEQFSSDYKISQTYYIPHGDDWFELDAQVGRETFYLLASSKQLFELEELINKYASVDRVKRPEVATQILAAIRQVKRQYLFTSYTERPASIAGNLRAIDKVDADASQSYNLGRLAIDISADNFYSRTFTIEHRQ
jgi:hypothetical protein